MAIPQTFDEAFERAKQLVSIFSENEGKYLSPGYSEAQARLDFIDKLWIALGWDVNHETSLILMLSLPKSPSARSTGLSSCANL